MTLRPVLDRFSAAMQEWYCQFLGTLAVWSYFVALGWDNNGFWYQGDSSVHASNGLFWADFLSRLGWHPVNFALSYYARYPSISPLAYPPVFYLLEAFFYRLVGTSPVVPKMLVMVFALFGTFYLIAWLRRWVSKEAGWFGVVFLLQPSIVIWGHAIMLNVPCTALGIAALYHWRRWLDDSTSQHVWWAFAFGILTVFTYIPTIIVVPVMIGWAIFSGRTRQLLDSRLIAVGCIAAIPLLIWLKVANHWDAGYREVSLYLGAYPAWKLSGWTYYLTCIPGLVSIPAGAFLCVAVALGLLQRRWPTEISFALIWIVLSYLWFSIFSVKEPRYVLLMVAPLIIIAAVGVLELLKMVCGSNMPIIAAVLGLIIGIHVWLAGKVDIPKVDGFSQAAAYLRALDPTAWVLYDGNYGQLFTLFYRLDDPNFSGGVVRADKLLYSSKISFDVQENVASAHDVAYLLEYDCGCRYILVERPMVRTIAAEQYLADVLRGEEFRLLRSFPLDTPGARYLDLYEYDGMLIQPASLKFKFPIIGDGVEMTMKPVRPKRE